MEERIAAEIRAEMARQKVTVKSLADKIGLSYQVVKNQLNGKSHLKIDEFLVPACGHLRIEIKRLFITN